MLINYAFPHTPVLRTGLAVFAGICMLAFGCMAAWCAAHAAAVVYAFQHNPGPFFCAERAHTWVESLGLPLERTIPLGVLCGGISLVSFVQGVRHINALRSSGHA